jgi:hypothetical protein
MPIITTKYALHNKTTGEWKEAANTLYYARTLAKDGWTLMDYDIDYGWYEVAPARSYRAFHARIGG